MGVHGAIVAHGCSWYRGCTWCPCCPWSPWCLWCVWVSCGTQVSMSVHGAYGCWVSMVHTWCPWVSIVPVMSHIVLGPMVSTAPIMGCLWVAMGTMLIMVFMMSMVPMVSVGALSVCKCPWCPCCMYLSLVLVCAPDICTWPWHPWSCMFTPNCTPIASASAVAPWLRPLQLLLLECVHLLSHTRSTKYNKLGTYTTDFTMHAATCCFGLLGGRALE